MKTMMQMRCFVKNAETKFDYLKKQRLLFYNSEDKKLSIYLKVLLCTSTPSFGK